MRKAWRFWKEWRPLVLWPLALWLMVRGIRIGAIGEDYARGTFLLVLGYIIDQSANESAQARLAEESPDAP